MRVFFIICWVLSSSLLRGQDSLVRYQYWFDDQYAQAQVGNFSGQSALWNLSTTSLGVGWHSLHVRFQQSDSLWSAVSSQEFYKPTSLQTIEYWFDQDYASRVQQTLYTDDTAWVQAISAVPGLIPGPHTLHYRVRQTDQQWSVVHSQPVLVPHRLTKLEYWYNRDYASRVTLPLNGLPDNYNWQTLLANLPTNGTAHSLHARVQQTDGSWSTVVSQSFNKANAINAYEYWFDGDYSTRILVNPGTGDPFSLYPSINVSALTLGSHTLFLRFRDLNQQWSSVITGGFCRNSGDSAIHVKLFLQGYMDANAQMVPVMQNQGVGNNPLLVDSIQAELHAATAPYQTLAALTTALYTNGEAVCAFPPAMTGNYYLVIKHRNTLETWTSYPIFKGTCPTYYDFTDADTRAYGQNQVEVVPGVWALYSGDINQDENTDLLDLSIVEADINAFQFGYFSTDINGDGNVDLLDGPVLENNISEFVFSAKP